MPTCTTGLFHKIQIFNIYFTHHLYRIYKGLGGRVHELQSSQVVGRKETDTILKW